MTEQGPARPLPGPPLPRPVHSDGSPDAHSTGKAPLKEAPLGEASLPVAVDRPDGTSFGELEQRPVSEHVGVFEAEHARLQRELGTIDSV